MVPSNPSREKGQEQGKSAGEVRLVGALSGDGEAGGSPSAKRTAESLAKTSSSHDITVTVEVVTARDLRAADRGGKSDPYCTLKMGREKKTTKVKKKTLAPVWGMRHLRLANRNES